MVRVRLNADFHRLLRNCINLARVLCVFGIAVGAANRLGDPCFIVKFYSSGYVHIPMTWDVIKQALFPGGEGSATLTVAYWSILVAFVGLEFFAPQLKKQRRAQRWPANFGLGLIN